MKSTMNGFQCKNPTCFSRTFVLLCFVTNRRNPTLGIGRVIQSENNNYTVAFKSGTHQLHSEYLERTILPQGTLVKTRNGQGVITEHTAASGKIFYKILFPDGMKSIQEQSIEEIIPSGPLDKLKSGEADPPQTFILKTLANFYQIAQQSEDLVCIRNSRIELLPHQVGIAHRVIQDYSPRYILADEVGLGKTMEAGLIMKEMKSRSIVKRVLIVTPASLVTQWQHEMRSKFNERFEIFDSRSESVHRSNHPDRDFFAHHDNVLCSIHYAKNRIDEFAGQFWDLLIIDEAHHLRRYYYGNDEIKTTQNYRFAAALKDRCGAMLLLTATPMQLDPYEFYSLIELIDPSLFRSYADFYQYNEDYGPKVKQILGRIRKNQNILLTKPKVMQEVNNLLDYGKKHFPQYRISNRSEFSVMQQLQNYLVISKLMIRNRRREVLPNLQKRIVTNLAVEYTPDEIRLYNEISEYVRTEYSRAVMEKNPIVGFAMVIFQKMLTSSKFTLLKSLKKRLGLSSTDIDLSRMAGEEDFNELDEIAQEEEIESLISAAGRSNAEKKLLEICEKIERFTYDSKVLKLTETIDAILKDRQGEKALIFTQFIATQDLLRKILSKKYSVVTFNGSMSKEEKDEKTEAFRRSAQIMISTEAGGEGRNFQFCHILFNFDLPWNPMKLEQRIGRLDRIGQKRNVMVYNFTTIDTVEQRVLSVLYERVNKFHETIGEMEPILGELEQDVKKVIMAQHADLDEEIVRLEKTIDKKLEEARFIQDKMQDFVMDKKQFNYETVDQILGKKPAVSPDDLRSYVKSALRDLGESARFEDNGKVCSIQLPFGFRRSVCSQTKYTGTFDQDYARENENTDFIAFGHELVIELLTRYSSGNDPAYAVFHDERIRPGYLFIYLAEIESFRMRQEFIPIFIDRSMTWDANMGKKCIGIFTELISQNPEKATCTPENAADYNQVAEAIMGEYIESESRKSETLQDDLILREKARIERLHNYRISKLTDELGKEQTLRAKIYRTDDENKKKILPALDGKIKAIEQRMEEEKAETKDQLDKLRTKSELKVSYSLFGIARFV
jgi:SNF2 family DNA or RNA helicase